MEIKNILSYIPTQFPAHVDIELNNTCNQKCIMCWHYSIPPFKLGKMPVGTAIKVINQSKNAKSVKFNWRGEPTLYKDLSVCLEHAKSLGLKTVINTNGITDIGLLKNIAEYLDIIIISVDSYYPDTYKLIHNASDGEADLLYSNIDALHLMMINKRYNGKVIINIHKSKYNNNWVSNYFNNIAQRIYYLFKINEQLTENREGANISLRKKIKYKKRCNQMYRRLIVSWNGDIYPCCVAYKEPKELRLGNIKDMTLRQAWNGYKLKKLRKLKKQNKLIYCRTCTSREVMK